MKKIIFRGSTFIVITTILSLFFYYDAASTFNNYYYSYKVNDLLPNLVCNNLNVETDDKSLELLSIINELENNIENSNVKIFKNFLRFNIITRNDLDIRDPQTKKSIGTTFTVNLNGIYKEVETGNEVFFPVRFNIDDIRANMHKFYYRVLFNFDKPDNICQEPSKYIGVDPKSDVKFRLTMSLFNLFIFFIVCLPISFGLILLCNGVYRFIFLGDPFGKK